MLFGPTAVAVSQLVHAVVADFVPGAPKTIQSSSVRHALDKLGSSLGYRVFVTDSEQSRTERDWLLDVVWWEPGRGVVLAANCQWGNAGKIAHDFQRLLAVKAPMKFMVFGSRQAGGERQDIALRTDIDAILRALGIHLIDFSQHVEGELFVLLEHVEEDSTFRGYEFRVPADGKLSTKYEHAGRLFHPVALQRVTVA